MLREKGRLESDEILGTGIVAAKEREPGGGMP